MDLIFREGFVVDGSGGPRRAEDVGVNNGRIVAVGSVSQPARREIDVRGLIVAPGFIDVHTHDDRFALIRPDMAPKISQGVTTIVGGNCGIAAAPVPLREPPAPPLTLLAGASADFFPSIATYRRALIAAQPATNVGANRSAACDQCCYASGSYVPSGGDYGRTRPPGTRK